MDIMAKRQCLVTIKDHKDDFKVNTNHRLFNPTKSELGKLKKHILLQISTSISIKCIKRESMGEFLRSNQMVQEHQKQKPKYVYRC